MIHIGNEIHNKLKEMERSPSWLAKRLHFERSNLYKLLDKPNIDVDRLLKISLILEFDFFRLYSEYIKDEINEKL